MKKSNSEVRRWIKKGFEERDPEKKLHYFNMALALEPENPAALNNKGMLFHKKGMFLKAIECYDRILEQQSKSNYVPALYNKSLALKKIERFEASMTFIKKASKLQPDNEKIKTRIEDLSYILKEKREAKNDNPACIPPEKFPVNQIYTQWEPPAVSTLLAYTMKCTRRDIKYHRGFGEDIIKEKAIKEKLNSKTYCCRTCRFYKKEMCRHIRTRAMSVLPDAICKNFRPKTQKNKDQNTKTRDQHGIS